MNTQKQLKDLNLLDRFLFAEVVEEPEALTDILEIILGKDVVLKHLPQTEKEERAQLWSKQIRLDVWAMDEDETIYETEVQKNNTRNLPKRSRLYQGVIDSKLLPPGEIDYNRLPDIFIIIIMPFDLFGKGRYRYTFYNQCEEAPGLPMGDGAVRIFLNTRGNVKDESVSQELIDLLHYFECSRPEVAEKSESERIHRLQTRVETIRASEETGVRFMNAWEERILDRQEGFEEGKQIGLEEGLEEGKAIQTREFARKLKEESFPLEKIAELTELSLEEIKKI